MDLNTLYYDDQDMKCKICMGYYDDPVISINCTNYSRYSVNCQDWETEIYCEKCLIEWNKKNEKSPIDNPKILFWIKIKEFTKFCVRAKIKTNQNLIKLIDMQPQTIDCSKLGLDDVLHILEIIDVENTERVGCKDYNNLVVFKEIFKNIKLIQSIINLFIENEVEWRGIDNWTIAHYICRFGSIELIKYIINLSGKNKKYIPIDVNNDNGTSATHYIFGNNNILNSNDQLKIIEYIINQPEIDLEIDDIKLGKPIHLLCGSETNMESSDHLKAIKMMISPPRVNLEAVRHDGKKAIHLICCKSHELKSSDQLNAIKILLDQKVDVADADNDSYTPLHHAVSKSNNLTSADQLRAMQLFLDYEKDINVDAITKTCWTIVHYVTGIANNFNSSDQLNALKYLIEYKENKGCVIDLNAETNTGWRAIHYTACIFNQYNTSDQVHALKILIEQKVDLNVMTSDNWTPFGLVCSNSNHFNSSDQIKAINLIINASPNIDSQIKSSDLEWSPLILVSSCSNKLSSEDQATMIKNFIDNKSMDLNIKNVNGWTAMHYICSGNNKMKPDDLINCIELLKKEGPRVNWDIQNTDGKKPIDLVFDETNKMTPEQKLILIQLLLK